MQRAKREARRQFFESLSQHRAAQALKKRQEQPQKEAAVRSALARPVTSARRSVEKLIESGFDPKNPLIVLAFRVRGGGVQWPFGEVRERFRVLLRTVADKAPKLIVADYMRPLMNLDRFSWIREIDDWEPMGKSRDSIFRSLVEHLLSAYNTPRFLWSAFFTNDDVKIAPIVDYVAKGGSLYDKVKSGELPVPLTRKMCHDFLQTTAEYTFLSGLRRTQIRSYGGGPHLFRVWMGGPIGSTLHEAVDEEFWATVLQFFSKNPLIDYAQVGPLVDYLQYRRRGDRNFSMKGRTVLALMRDMHVWHGDLAKERSIKGTAFEPSGFKAGSYERAYQEPLGRVKVLWTIEEILTSKALADEGRALRHCVYSYAYKIGMNTSSIWSMRANEERVVTIQVDNRNEKIVQYRGKFNAIPGAREFQILKEWADSNHLKIGQNGW
jgi:hypothetical protein